jgi:hypothetical protein
MRAAPIFVKRGRKRQEARQVGDHIPAFFERAIDAAAAVLIGEFAQGFFPIGLLRGEQLVPLGGETGGERRDGGNLGGPGVGKFALRLAGLGVVGEGGLGRGRRGGRSWGGRRSGRGGASFGGDLFRLRTGRQNGQRQTLASAHQTAPSPV